MSVQETIHRLRLREQVGELETLYEFELVNNKWGDTEREGRMKRRFFFLDHMLLSKDIRINDDVMKLVAGKAGYKSPADMVLEVIQKYIKPATVRNITKGLDGSSVSNKKEFKVRISFKKILETDLGKKYTLCGAIGANCSYITIHGFNWKEIGGTKKFKEAVATFVPADAEKERNYKDWVYVIPGFLARFKLGVHDHFVYKSTPVDMELEYDMGTEKISTMKERELLAWDARVVEDAREHHRYLG